MTVCNQNRVHCGHLKQLIAEEMVKASHLNITEAYNLLEEDGTAELGEELDEEMAIIYSLLEDTGCRTNFNKYDENTDTNGKSSGCAFFLNLRPFNYFNHRELYI